MQHNSVECDYIKIMLENNFECSLSNNELKP